MTSWKPWFLNHFVEWKETNNAVQVILSLIFGRSMIRENTCILARSAYMRAIRNKITPRSKSGAVPVEAVNAVAMVLAAAIVVLPISFACSYRISLSIGIEAVRFVVPVVIGAHPVTNIEYNENAQPALRMFCEVSQANKPQSGKLGAGEGEVRCLRYASTETVRALSQTAVL